MDKTASGKLGEEFALTLLQKNGYKILEKNFKTKVGEIDIIAVDNDTLVFVEVKTRWGKKFGLPQEAVGPRKLSRVTRASQFYTLTHPNTLKKQRIDVVAVEMNGKKVEHSKIIKLI